MIEIETPLMDELVIKMQHRHRCLTLERMEKEVGISRSWLSKFQTGNLKNPGYPKLVKLKKYLEMHETAQ